MIISSISETNKLANVASAWIDSFATKTRKVSVKNNFSAVRHHWKEYATWNRAISYWRTLIVPYYQKNKKLIVYVEAIRKHFLFSELKVGSLKSNDYYLLVWSILLIRTSSLAIKIGCRENFLRQKENRPIQ